MADLDLYEFAFLAGGRERVVDTAVVVLVESGRLRVHPPGELSMVEAFRRHPVEAAVLDAVGARGHRSVDTIRWRSVNDDRITGLARRLADAGLLRRRSLHRRGRWAPTRAGRALLRRGPLADPSLDGGSAVLVAQHGRAAMTDTALRSAVFERPTPRQLSAGEIGRRIRRSRWDAASGSAMFGAHQSHTALGGAAGFGLDAGGGGGGDGGGS
ncbi:TIGR04222 domain-containing membrane protein [Blastococcus sp. MG754426]|nr:TIGR04222 domain-containing membrane protein [Blastococcus sp. MG754426]MCF6511788.1 TIGR04222 domain-containing membrane protein [Blastococcus sp. MG754427]MCF6734718.1 TIGR04222 domain-containing membrane protein [Blastococcus sp. KM273129]